jgi:hypothetical protein
MTESRGWPDEDKARARVQEEFGDQLDAMARMRTRTFDELVAAGLTDEGLQDGRGVILAILLRAVGAFDSIRILLEHGYSEEAFGLTRILYDAEIDAFLLGSGNADYLERFADFELWEMGMTAARGLDAGLVPDGSDIADAVRSRKAELRDRLHLRGIEIPDGFEEMTLLEAATVFSKLRFSKRMTWRPDRSWDDTLDEVAPALIRLVEPATEAEDPDRFSELIASRKAEHRISYSLMSATLHNSPMSVAMRVNGGFRLAGVIDEVGKVVHVSAVHFARTHHLVCDLVGIPFDEASWRMDLQAVGGQRDELGTE